MNIPRSAADLQVSPPQVSQLIRADQQLLREPEVDPPRNPASALNIDCS